MQSVVNSPGSDIAGCAAMLSSVVGDGPEPYQALGFSSFTDSGGATLGCLNFTLAPVDPNQHCEGLLDP